MLELLGASHSITYLLNWGLGRLSRAITHWKFWKQNPLKVIFSLAERKVGRLNLGIAHTSKRWDLKRWCCIQPGTKHEQNQTKTREFIYKTVKKTPDSIASIKSSTHVDPNANHYITITIFDEMLLKLRISHVLISQVPPHFKWSNEKLSFERCLIGDLVHSLPSAAKKLSLLMVRYVLKPDSKLRASFAFLLALFILSFL